MECTYLSYLPLLSYSTWLTQIVILWMFSILIGIVLPNLFNRYVTLCIFWWLIRFYQGKMYTFKYFFGYELPKIEGLSKRLLQSDGLTVEMQPDHFDDWWKRVKSRWKTSHNVIDSERSLYQTAQRVCLCGNLIQSFLQKKVNRLGFGIGVICILKLATIRSDRFNGCEIGS